MNLTLESLPKNTLRTVGGFTIDLLDPKPESINIQDIAWGLSHICRWGGHIDQFMSVAEHACLVHDIVAARVSGTDAHDLIAAALHHDDHESYLGDIPTPIKRLVGAYYYPIVEKFDNAICKKLGLDQELFHYEVIVQADRLALELEATNLRGETYPVELPEGVRCFFGLSPELAYKEYLLRAGAIQIG